MQYRLAHVYADIDSCPGAQPPYSASNSYGADGAQHQQVASIGSNTTPLTANLAGLAHAGGGPGGQ